MKVVILSGGKGINLPERGDFVTKALISVNEAPLLYYILKHFFFYGFKDMILAVDSNSEGALRGFLDDAARKPELNRLISKLHVDIRSVGERGKTGSMLYMLRDELRSGDFIVTYNDTISDINLSRLVQFHRTKSKVLTMTGVHPTIRHGVVTHEDGIVLSFRLEEPIRSTIKGGYFVCSPRVFDYLEEDCIFENEPLQRIISEREASLFDHSGFWKQFDSYKNIEEMERLFKESDTSWLIK